MQVHGSARGGRPSSLTRPPSLAILAFRRCQEGCSTWAVTRWSSWLTMCDEPVQGKQHMPIGLKLDTAKVLEAANKGQHLRK